MVRLPGYVFGIYGMGLWVMHDSAKTPARLRERITRPMPGDICTGKSGSTEFFCHSMKSAEATYLLLLARPNVELKGPDSWELNGIEPTALVDIGQHESVTAFSIRATAESLNGSSLLPLINED
ncbi:unnamed protein product, partial [Chrysoparadoxa australica]